MTRFPLGGLINLLEIVTLGDSGIAHTPYNAHFTISYA